MLEGWHGDDYLILFAENEVVAVSARYAVDRYLPGFQVIGLCGWDDLIVRDASVKTFCAPAVPLDPQFLAPFQVPPATATLKGDICFTDKIKWYVKPIVFGGDPAAGENLIWVDHEQHGQLVTWWNNQYRDLRARQGGA